VVDACRTLSGGTLEFHMQQIEVDQLDDVVGGAVSAGEAAGLALGGLALVVGAIGAAPVLSASALGWGFGSAIAWVGGYTAGAGANHFYRVTFMQQ
jgi:hypothetical protein